MNLDEFMITYFCWLDELVPLSLCGQRLHQRGLMPQLSDSEVLTIEVIDIYLGLSQDKALFAYFQQHDRHLFPALAGWHRATFVRQAANLWAIKERLWCVFRAHVDTLHGHLTDRCYLNRVWARDLWHPRNRLLRAVVMHILYFSFNQREMAPCLQFDRLVA